MEDVEEAYCDPGHDASCTSRQLPSSGIFNFLGFRRCMNEKRETYILIVWFVSLVIYCTLLTSALCQSLRELTSWGWNMEGLEFVDCPLPPLCRSPLTSFSPHSGFGPGRTNRGYGWSTERWVRFLQTTQLRVFACPTCDQWKWLLSCCVVFRATNKLPSLRKLWRTCTWQREPQRSLLVLANSSMFSTSKLSRGCHRCIKRTYKTKLRERSDGGLASCLPKTWRWSWRGTVLSSTLFTAILTLLCLISQVTSSVRQVVNCLFPFVELHHRAPAPAPPWLTVSHSTGTSKPCPSLDSRYLYSIYYLALFLWNDISGTQWRETFNIWCKTTLGVKD